MLRWAIRAVAANSYKNKAISESKRASSKANEAKRKFKVYPSAYANGWLVRTYKKRGGGYRSS